MYRCLHKLEDVQGPAYPSMQVNSIDFSAREQKWADETLSRSRFDPGHGKPFGNTNIERVLV